jgi:RHS repeat-associated protein
VGGVNTSMTSNSAGLRLSRAVDSSGTIVQSYAYDAFGAVRSQSGSQPKEHQFAGQDTDPSGLHYLRARYYDPATGRCLSRDPDLRTHCGHRRRGEEKHPGEGWAEPQPVCVRDGSVSRAPASSLIAPAGRANVGAGRDRR